MQQLLTKPYYANGAVTARRVVKLYDDNHVDLCSANSDAMIGISGSLDVAAGGPIDVSVAGVGQVVLGGNVTRGAVLTADSAGAAVALSSTMLDAAACRAIGVAMQSGVSGDYIDILIYPQRQGKSDALTVSVAELDVFNGAPMDATITVGVEGTNTINVAIQLKNADGDDLAVRGNVKAYLSDDANGDSIVATAPSGGGAIGTDGLAIPLVTNKAWMLTSESDGDIDITFTETGTKTMYLILVFPNGKLKASGAITFAA